MNERTLQAVPSLPRALPAPVEYVRQRSRPFSQSPARYVVIGAGIALVVLLPPTLSIALLIGIAAFCFFLERPYLSLYAIAFAVPFESVKNLNFGGLNVTVTNMLVFSVAAAILSRQMAMGSVKLGPMPWRRVLVIYGAVLLLSIAQATDYVSSIKEMLKWGQLLFAYIGGVTLLQTRKEMRMMLIVIFAAAMCESAVGVVQAVLHSGPSSFGRGAFLRSSGTFDQPNPFAGYLNMIFPLALTCLIFKIFPRKYMWWVVIVLGVGILGSLSRGAQLGTITALLVMGSVSTPRVRQWLPLLATIILLFFSLLLLGLVPQGISNPLVQGLGIGGVDVVNPTPDDWSVAERLAHMEAGINMWLGHPIFGVGIGNYPAQYPNYQVAPVWGPPLGHAHNYYINIAAEAGIFGFVAFIALLVSAMRICLRAVRIAPDNLGRAVGLGVLGVIVAFAVHEFFDDLFVHGMEAQLGLVMALATRASHGDDGGPAIGEDPPVDDTSAAIAPEPAGRPPI
jgi:O-antigen ligase